MRNVQRYIFIIPNGADEIILRRSDIYVSKYRVIISEEGEREPLIRNHKTAFAPIIAFLISAILHPDISALQS